MRGVRPFVDHRGQYCNEVRTSCTAINFGPRVGTYKHRDMLNCPYGMCVIQALGNFDHTKGGHLILGQLNLMMEFPAGFLALIPSATITHSNSPVSRNETRFYFTQFCPGVFCDMLTMDFKAEDPMGFAGMSRKKPSQWAERLQLIANCDDILNSLS